MYSYAWIRPSGWLYRHSCPMLKWVAQLRLDSGPPNCMMAATLVIRECDEQPFFPGPRSVEKQFRRGPAGANGAFDLEPGSVESCKSSLTFYSHVAKHPILPRPAFAPLRPAPGCEKDPVAALRVRDLARPAAGDRRDGCYHALVDPASDQAGRAVGFGKGRRRGETPASRRRESSCFRCHDPKHDRSRLQPRGKSQCCHPLWPLPAPIRARDRLSPTCRDQRCSN